MKSIQVLKKYETPLKDSQAEKRKSGKTGITAALLMAAGIAAGVDGVCAQSTSPLEILQHAPKVRIDDPDPTPPVAVAPAPAIAPPPAYLPPQGAAPPIQPVAPAFSPYAGHSTMGEVAPPGRPRYAATPTPRPILGPEDVEKARKKEKKGGIVRGLIRAIPFVGGDDDAKAPTPSPAAPGYGRAPGYAPGNAPGNAPGGPVYRGYDAPSAERMADDPILLPPGATPLHAAPEPSFADPEPSSPGDHSASPPIMTPEPRLPAPATPPADDDAAGDAPVNLDSADPAADSTSDSAMAPARAPDSANEPVLTVKRESDERTTGAAATDAVMPEASRAQDPAPAEAAAGRDITAKKPALSPTATETPKPLERATTGVLIQESRPSAARAGALGPEPDASATVLKPYDPTAAETTTSPVTDASAVVVDDLITSLSIEQADLGMPNPAYEQNTSVLAEFQDGVRRARIDDHAGAARAFREYALNHPSSGLAPRAYFLSVIFENSRSQAQENFESLKRLFPESRYVKEAQKRRGEELKGTAVAAAGSGAAGVDTAAADAGAAATATPMVSAETPLQQIARLERELTAAVGNADTEPELRKRLGVLYLEQEQYDRAYEILRPAADMAAGTPLEGEILLGLGRTLMARGETVQAISLYEAVETKHPGMIESNASSAWSVGLAYEGAGRYSKSRVLYNTIRQKWPASAEAGWAAVRLQDLAALRQ